MPTPYRAARFPPLRSGKTPYGVLPVTSLRNYKSDSDFAGPVEPGLANFMTRLWPTWLNFLNLFGRALLNFYGFGAWNPRVLNLAFAEASFPVQFPTVQTGPLSETDPLKADADLGGGVKGNYINWLQTASVADLHAENYPGSKPTSLLYKILRQSLLLDYANLAGQQEVRVGNLQAVQIKETEIVAVQPRPITLTPLEVLARLAIANPRLSWAEYFLVGNFGAGSPSAQLKEVRASLTRLASLPTTELDRSPESNPQAAGRTGSSVT